MKLPADPGGHVWPSPEQELLLRAALAKDGRSGPLFCAWLTRVDIEGPVDEGTYRALPLLWNALARDRFDHPLLPRLKGVFRNAWVQNMQRLALAESILATLQAEGIDTLVSKGLPLALVYYERPALRPMNDIDIIVPAAQVEQASRLLEAEGFISCRKDWPLEKALRHALVHRHAEGAEIDLHWHMLYERPTQTADVQFWDAALPFRIGTAETLRPCATDLLVHVLVHGIRWNLSPPMRWVPDAMMILRSGDAFDWDRLVGFAACNGLSQRVALGLDYLRDRFDAPVPSEAIERLYDRSSLVERIEMLAMRGTGERSPWRHVRRGAYLLRLARSDHAVHLPRAVLSELWGRLRGKDARGATGLDDSARGARAL